MELAVLKAIQLPNLNPNRYTVKSVETDDYNCIAWAAGDNTRRWDVEPSNRNYWPESVPREHTLSAFIKLYESIGFQVTDSNAQEPGFEKIAIYVNVDGLPSHVAKQHLDSLTESVQQVVVIPYHTTTSHRQNPKHQ